MFLWIDGVRGESSFNNQEGWIAINSFTIMHEGQTLWSGTNNSFKAPQGRETLPVGASFVLVKNIDETSPQLSEAFNSHTKFPKVRLVLMGTIGDKKINGQIILEDAQIKNITTRDKTRQLAWEWASGRAILE